MSPTGIPQPLCAPPTTNIKIDQARPIGHRRNTASLSQLPAPGSGLPNKIPKKPPATRPIARPHQSKPQPTNPPAQAFLNRQFDHRLNQSARRAFSIAKSIPFQALLAIPRCQILSGSVAILRDDRFPYQKPREARQKDGKSLPYNEFQKIVIKFI